MNFKISFEEGTSESFTKSYDYYAKISGKVADIFNTEFWQAVADIKKDPLLY